MTLSNYRFCPRTHPHRRWTKGFSISLWKPPLRTVSTSSISPFALVVSLVITARFNAQIYVRRRRPSPHISGRACCTLFQPHASNLGVGFGPSTAVLQRAVAIGPLDSRQLLVFVILRPVKFEERCMTVLRPARTRTRRPFVPVFLRTFPPYSKHIPLNS